LKGKTEPRMVNASTRIFSASTPADVLAATLAGSVSAALMLGALAFQYLGGYAPCEMCIWQRWPHGVAIVLGLAGGVLVSAKAVPAGYSRAIALAAILALAASGAIGVFHAGVEWKWWPGPSACSGFGYVPGRDDFKPLQIVRCDEAQWRMLGISLAGYNALFSLLSACAALSLLGRKRWKF
jgi:disulfide bond formation protein DsbB